jgi:peptidoglycan DL-endopeptidase RipA
VSQPPRTVTGRRRLRLTGRTASAALALTALTFMAGPAGAKPGPTAQDVAKGKRQVQDRAAAVGQIRSRLAQAAGELTRLATSAEVAVERYNGQLVRLAQTRTAYQLTQQRLTIAQQNYDQTRAQVAAFAAEAYRINSGLSDMSLLTGPGGPQGFIDRAGMLEVLARRQADTSRRMYAAQVIADMYRRQAKDGLRAQQQMTGAAEQAKIEADAAVAAQRAAVGRIKADEAQLVRELHAARAHVALLKRQREEAALSAIGVLKGSGRGLLVARAALSRLGTPYSWGGGAASGPTYGSAQGSGTRGFDCSGLVVYAWAKAGVSLDHWTGTQWNSGPHIPTDLLRPGDLVFFATDTANPDTIHHVGIYIGGGQMVEAPYTGGQVRVSSIWRPDLIGATRPV